MPFPDQLDRLREQFGHHIALLMLLSRSDGEAIGQERDVILHHCLDQARKGGLPAMASEAAELGDYLRELRPIFAQLQPAIRRLEDSSKDEVIAVVAAAIAVVDADGSQRPREVEFLTELKHELHSL